MLKERAGKFYSEDNDLNCAECLLHGANEEYDLGLDQKGLDTMSSFGGGMAVESVCRAFTGGVAVLGVMFTGDKSMDSEKRKAIISDIYKRFEDHFGSVYCSKIKEKFRDDVTGCRGVVEHSAEILDEIIQKYQ